MIQSKRAFTLIELLVVIAVLGILSAGVFTAINITGNLNKANLAKAKTFSASVENALSINQVGKWSFDDSVTPGKDTSGYGRNLSLFGGAAISASECGLGFRTCLELDGVDKRAQLGAGSAFSDPFEWVGGGLTVSVWVKRDLPEIGGGWIISKPFTGGYNYFIEAKSDGKIYVRVAGDTILGGASWGVETTAKLPFGEWTHLVLVLDNLLVKLYFNGNLSYSQAHGIISWAAVTGDIALTIGAIYPYLDNPGASCVNCSFAGKIDEVAIYNQALFASQIQQLYAQGLLRHQLALK